MGGQHSGLTDECWRLQVRYPKRLVDGERFRMVHRAPVTHLFGGPITSRVRRHVMASGLTVLCVAKDGNSIIQESLWEL